MIEYPVNSQALQTMTNSDIKEDVVAGKVEVAVKPFLTEDELITLSKDIKAMRRSIDKEKESEQEFDSRLTKMALRLAENLKIDAKLMLEKVMGLKGKATTRDGKDIKNDSEKILSEVAWHLNQATLSSIQEDKDTHNRIAGECLQECLSVPMTKSYCGTILTLFTVNPLNSWVREFAALQVGYESATNKSGITLLSKSQKKGYSKMASTPKPTVVTPPAEVVPTVTPTVTPKPQVQQKHGKHGKR